jgi:hypothetical protein
MTMKISCFRVIRRSRSLSILLKAVGCRHWSYRWRCEALVQGGAARHRTARVAGSVTAYVAVARDDASPSLVQPRPSLRGADVEAYSRINTPTPPAMSSRLSASAWRTGARSALFCHKSATLHAHPAHATNLVHSSVCLRGVSYFCSFADSMLLIDSNRAVVRLSLRSHRNDWLTKNSIWCTVPRFVATCAVYYVNY